LLYIENREKGVIGACKIIFAKLCGVPIIGFMKDYLIAWVLTGFITLAGLFAVGFVIGIFGAITGSISDPNQLETKPWFQLLVIFSMAIINFFAFRFTVKKFVVKD
tara:strand:+ start:285 stop:602 length:318 start_codon:yes stop_codon:yes gene_type:complete